MQTIRIEANAAYYSPAIAKLAATSTIRISPFIGALFMAVFSANSVIFAALCRKYVPFL